MNNAIHAREHLADSVARTSARTAGVASAASPSANAVHATGPLATWWEWLWDVPMDGPKATLLLRLMAGSVFLWEGVMKFVFANQGVGRFTKLGFPFPGPTADVVAVIEILGGVLLLTGLQTRVVGLVFIGEMIVAVTVWHRLTGQHNFARCEEDEVTRA